MEKLTELIDNPDFWNDWQDQPVATTGNRFISRQQFLQQAIHLSNQLPEKTYAINLCKDRYHFAVAFLAVLLKNQTSILPSNNAPQNINELIEEYADSYLLGDEANDRDYRHYYRVPAMQNEGSDNGVISREKIQLNPDHLAVITFTSGSTGKAKPNHKYWWQLEQATRLALQRFSLSGLPARALISTVPPQHMYGLETSILYPLLGHSVLISGQTFFPDDIRERLEESSLPAILITTPVHLRACLRANLKWPSLEKIISATAPLDKATAMQVEKLFNCPVMEIFGSTETGAIASRRTVEGSHWLLYDRVKIKQQLSSVSLVKGPQHEDWVELSDYMNILDDQHFELLGRHTDMVKIAGKRASIADLSIKLVAIDGVIDGVIFHPDNDTSGVNRLIAFVIAPALTEKQISKALSEMIDPVFLPRPIIKVDTLPRSETGKLTHSNLQKLYTELDNRV